MTTALEYLKLHFKLMFKKDKDVSVRNKVTSLLMGTLTCVVILLLLKVVFDIINEQFPEDVSHLQFSVLLFTLIEVVLVIVGVVLEINNFLKPKDLHITARFPIGAKSLFVAQLLIVYIYMFIFSLFSIVPILTLYAWSSGILSLAFLGNVLLCTLFAPLIPFALATVIAVPTMFILSALQNRNTLKLIFFVLILCAGFVLYNFVLNFLAEYYIYQKINATMQESVTMFVNAVNASWNIFKYIANIAFATDIFASIGKITAIFAGVLLIGILMAIPVYSHVHKNALEGKKNIYYNNSKLTSDSAFVAIFKKDFTEIIRNHTYSYFYIGISIITPVMVYLTSRLIQKVGQAQMGGEIGFGVSLLVVFAFISMIDSFSAIAISREGKQFYITKIIPVKYKTQLLAKGLLNVIVSMVAILASVIILCSMLFISVAQGAVLFVIATIFSIAVIFNGFNINLNHPYINIRENDDQDQTNITITMLIGLLATAVLGGFAIVLSFLTEPTVIYFILLGFCVLYATMNILAFFLNVNKKYSQIE